MILRAKIIFTEEGVCCDAARTATQTNAGKEILVYFPAERPVKAYCPVCGYIDIARQNFRVVYPKQYGFDVVGVYQVELDESPVEV